MKPILINIALPKSSAKSRVSPNLLAPHGHTRIHKQNGPLMGPGTQPHVCSAPSQFIIFHRTVVSSCKSTEQSSVIRESPKPERSLSLNEGIWNQQNYKRSICISQSTSWSFLRVNVAWSWQMTLGQENKTDTNFRFLPETQKWLHALCFNSGKLA